MKEDVQVNRSAGDINSYRITRLGTKVDRNVIVILG